MRLKILLLVAVLVFAAEAISAETIRFVNGMWFDGTVFRPKTVYSVNGNLVFGHAVKFDSTMDLQNGYVIPPFAEAHTHQFMDVMNYREQIDDFLAKGIFYAKNLNSIPRFTVRIRPLINIPTSIDIAYANGGLTATGGHPVEMFDRLANGMLPGVTPSDMPGQAYFIIDDENDLTKKWSAILAGKPDFIKTYLEHSEEYELRKNDAKYFGKKGLNPKLLAAIVTRAHRDKLRVSVHIATARDFHNAVTAGVDEIAHLPLERIDTADAKLAVARKIFVVTTTLGHRETAGIQDLDEINRYNLKLLYKTGVGIALGTDNMPSGVVEEAENIYRLKVFDNLTLIKLWTENTPRTIFPNRKIGLLKDGYEASFLVLRGDPIKDFSNVRKIDIRYKQGQIINK